MNIPLATLVQDIKVKSYKRKIKKVKKSQLNDPLTPREIELWLTMAQKGFNKKALANYFNLSVKSIDAHMHHIFIKLGVHSTPELITLAWKRGICTAEAIDLHQTLSLISLLDKLDTVIDEAKKIIEEIRLCNNTSILTTK